MASEVVLVPHDRRWHAAAQDEAVRLLRVSSALVAVHHMGSTSIAGIVAKPIIDLLGVARDLASIDQERPVLEALGYEWRGEYGIAGRRYCISSDGAGRRLHHLHCYGIGDPAIVRHLAFRDHLRRLPSVAAAYERKSGAVPRCIRRTVVRIRNARAIG